MLSALRWVGGKSGRSTTGSGRWIAGLLPQDGRYYFEPFGGMLGVLLQRPYQQEVLETVGDADGRLINWWRQVRHNPEEMTEWLNSQPDWSTDLYEEAIAGLDAADRVYAALCFTVAVHWGFGGKIGHQARSEEFIARPSTRLSSIPIVALSERVRFVAFHHWDALRFISTFGDKKGAVWYVDPPYPSAGQNYYGHDVDPDALVAALMKIRGRVAVSGYDDDWNGLGWGKHEREVSTPLQADGASRRVECVWMNFQPPLQGLFE